MPVKNREKEKMCPFVRRPGLSRVHSHTRFSCVGCYYCSALHPASCAPIGVFQGENLTSEMKNNRLYSLSLASNWLEFGLPVGS